MADLKRTTQTGGGVRTGITPEGEQGEHNQGAEFGTSDRATRGTDRDVDGSGTSKNQGHGHPREERGSDLD
ncbi:MAG TPA: hypothetical protein VGR37_05100 [Longimicrobiaceae bacterium]|nr:hypothetical protein [Longimicrobiaceae bacterium]